MKRREFIKVNGMARRARYLCSPATRVDAGIKWRLTASWPNRSRPGGASLEVLAKHVRCTDNKLPTSLAGGEIVPGCQVLSVQNGTVEWGIRRHTTIRQGSSLLLERPCASDPTRA